MGVTRRIQGHRAYLEIKAPGQCMGLPIPQAELPVMATGEESVLEGMCAEPPELIRVTLQQSMGCHLCGSPKALPSLLPGALAPVPRPPRQPGLQGRSPEPDLPSATHSSWSPPAAQSQAPLRWPAQPQSVPESAGWWQKVRAPLTIPLPPPSSVPGPGLTSASWRATNPGPHWTSRRSRPPPLSTVPSRRRHRAKMDPS